MPAKKVNAKVVAAKPRTTKANAVKKQAAAAPRQVTLLDTLCGVLHNSIRDMDNALLDHSQQLFRTFGTNENVVQPLPHYPSGAHVPSLYRLVALRQQLASLTTRAQYLAHGGVDSESSACSSWQNLDTLFSGEPSEAAPSGVGAISAMAFLAYVAEDIRHMSSHIHDTIQGTCRATWSVTEGIDEVEDVKITGFVKTGSRAPQIQQDLEAAITNITNATHMLAMPITMLDLL